MKDTNQMLSSLDVTNSKIELVWPTKHAGFVPIFGQDGVWRLSEPTRDRFLFGLNAFDSFGDKSNSTGNSLFIKGNRLNALETIKSGFNGAIKVAYIDAPRIGVDDKDAAFQVEGAGEYSVWLSVIREHLLAVRPLMRRDGLVIIQTDPEQSAFAQLLLEEIFRPENRVASIVWQRSYAPRNSKNMQEFTDTHENLYVYAFNKAQLPAIGLKRPAKGFDNPDGDPRGEWKAEHKGAHSRRARSDFNTYRPPYRWELVTGRLPDGLWRVAPLTGVIFGWPREAGEFPITVRATDAEGNTADRELVINVSETGQAPEYPDIPWLFEEINTDGPLKISNTSLPTGVVSQPYSAILLAEGGIPFKGKPIRPSRYWEFADYTLLKAYQEDRVYLGRDGTSIPAPKKYREDLGDFEVDNQVSWWPAKQKTTTKTDEPFVGYTEDATRHLKALRDHGYIAQTTNTAKPELLIKRLIEVFSEPGDTILSVFSGAGDVPAVAVKTGRTFVHLAGESDRDEQLANHCALPRLRTVISGNDCGLHETDAADTRTKARQNQYIPYSGGGHFYACTLSDWVFSKKQHQATVRMNDYSSRTVLDLSYEVLTARGFIPEGDSTQYVYGKHMSSSTTGIILNPKTYLTNELLAEIVDEFYGSNASKRGAESLQILYFRASNDLNVDGLPTRIRTCRIPTEVTV